MRLGALLYSRSRALYQQSAIPYVALVVFSYLRMPWSMAMPMHSSSTYHATINMMPACVQCLSSRQVATGNILRMARYVPSNPAVHQWVCPWRSLVRQR